MTKNRWKKNHGRFKRIQWNKHTFKSVVITIKSVVITRAVMPWMAKVYLEIISPVCCKLEMREPTVTMQSVRMDLPLWVPSSQVLTLPWKLNVPPWLWRCWILQHWMADGWLWRLSHPVTSSQSKQTGLFLATDDGTVFPCAFHCRAKSPAGWMFCFVYRSTWSSCFPRLPPWALSTWGQWQVPWLRVVSCSQVPW